MPAANVPLDVDQGEDWSADVVWTDNYDQPVNVIHPCRLEVKDGSGATILQLDTDPDIPEGEIPGINLSSEIGLMQLHMTTAQTVALNPGRYNYDLFATIDDGNEYTGTQLSRLIFGAFTVNKTITRMS